MIRVEGLRKAYGGTPVLEEVSFGVGAGERVAILGMNGAGKTTLFRCILGLTGFQGSVTVDGVRVGGEGPEARKRLGYVPQRAPVSDQPLADFVALFAGLRDTPVEHVEAVLKSLGLSLARDGAKPLSALSGGMLQKALLGLAVGSKAPVLLLDEPTANLDPVARNDFLGALSRVDRSRTLFLASHRLSEVEALADRLLVLHGGRLAFQGSMDELRARTGARPRLWIEIADGDRSRAVALLEEWIGVGDVSLNGRGVRVNARSSERGPLIGALAAQGIELGDIRTEDEPLTHLLGRLNGAWEADEKGDS